MDTPIYIFISFGLGAILIIALSLSGIVAAIKSLRPRYEIKVNLSNHLENALKTGMGHLKIIAETLEKIAAKGEPE